MWLLDANMDVRIVKLLKELVSRPGHFVSVVTVPSRLSIDTEPPCVSMRTDAKTPANEIAGTAVSWKSARREFGHRR